MNKKKLEEAYYQDIIKSATWYNNIELSDVGIQSHWNTIPYTAIASTHGTFIPPKRNLLQIISFWTLGVMFLPFSIGFGAFLFLIAGLFYITARKKIYMLEVTNHAWQSRNFCTYNPKNFATLKVTIEQKIQETHQKHR